MELIAASRIVKAQRSGRAVHAVRDRADPRGVGGGDLLERRPPADHRAGEARRGPRSSSSPPTAVWPAPSTPNALKEAELLAELLRARARRSYTYLVGRKAVGYFSFRSASVAESWTGVTDAPTFANAKEIADALIESLPRTRDGDGGVDEIHIVYNRFVLDADAGRRDVLRLLPLEVVDEGARGAGPPEGEILPLYEFEPIAADGARRAAAGVHREPHLQRAAAVGRLRARRHASGR